MKATVTQQGSDQDELKLRIRQHWEAEPCGQRNGSSQDRHQFFEEIDRERYCQEPMLQSFARFDDARAKRVLEVGLGTGADFIRWVRAEAIAYGRDLTDASVSTVRQRLELEQLQADVQRGDAEKLEFPDNYFDIYYSWGVLMATPDTEKAIAEAHRVLKPGGVLKIMLYHYPSVGAVLVWLAHGPLRLNFQGPRASYYDHVESPGMKMYTRTEAEALIRRHFPRNPICMKTYLGAGDLLTHKLGPRYQGAHWRALQRIYPRWFVKHVIGNRFGTELTIEVVK